MVKQILRRVLSLALSAVLVGSLLPAISTPALAAVNGTLTGLSNEDIGASYSGSDDGSYTSWAVIGGNGITGTAKSKDGGSCGSDTKYNTTLTLTNNKGTDAILSFDYKITLSGGTVTVAGVEASADGSYKDTLEPSASIKIYLESGDVNNDTKIEIANLSMIVETNVTTTFQPAEGGSYTVDGMEISTDTPMTRQSTIPYRLSATANDGYKFRGWYSVTNSTYLSFDEEASLFFDSAQSVTAQFISVTTPLFRNDGQMFTDLAEACASATSGEDNTVVLVSDGTLPEGAEYTIPDGVTLLIPYDETYSAGTEDTILLSSNPSLNTLNSNVRPYRTLTVPQGTTVHVDGTLIVNGRVDKGQGYTYNGVVYGTYGKMILDGTLDIRPEANLYVRGYIVASDHTAHDESSALGSIEVASGASVYMPLQMMDYRGGNCSLAVGGKVFPVSNYYFQNIMVSTTYQAGARLYGQWTVYAALGSIVLDEQGEAALMSSEDDAMFQCTSGSVTTNYQYDGDQLLIDIQGDVSVNGIRVEAGAIGAMDTDGKPIPLNNVTINICDGGTLNCDKDLKLVPGAEIVVQEGGTFNLSGSVYLYQQDAFQARWYRNSTIGRLRLAAPGIVQNNGKTVKETDARIVVAGTMNVQSGAIWESSSPAHSGGVVGVDGGTVNFTSLPEANTTTSIYEVNNASSTADSSISWRPVTGLLAGLSTAAGDNQLFSLSGAGIYYAKDLLGDPNNAAWYQHTISVQDGKPGLAAAGPSTNFDQEYTAKDPIIGYSVTNGSFSVTAPGLTPDDVTLTVDDTELTPDEDGVYTLQGIDEDKVIELEIPVAVIISVNGDTLGKFATLAEAITAYQDTGYIQLTADVTEESVTIDRNVYLDLNGFTVPAVNIISGTLYGMDSATDTYSSADYGKITAVTGNVAPVCKSPEASDGTYERYLAIAADDGSWSFHRFNISVTGYWFELNTITKECGLMFLGTFRGDDAVKGHLRKITMTLTENGTPKDVVIPNPSANDYRFGVYVVRAISAETLDKFRRQFGVTATVTFEEPDGSQTSDQHYLSFEEAWTAKDNTFQTGNQKDLEEFLKELDLDASTT